MRGQSWYPQPSTPVYPPNYTYPTGQTPPDQPKDIPTALVVGVGILLWVLLFGGAIAFAAASPCGTVSAIVRDKASLAKLEERTQFSLSDPAQCREFLRECVLKSCADRMQKAQGNESV